jgi:hypothetical protein
MATAPLTAQKPPTSLFIGDTRYEILRPGIPVVGKTAGKTALYAINFTIDDLSIVGTPNDSGDPKNAYTFRYVVHCIGAATQSIASDELLYDVIENTKYLNGGELPSVPAGNRVLQTLPCGKAVWIPVIPDIVAPNNKKGRKPSFKGGKGGRAGGINSRKQPPFLLGAETIGLPDDNTALTFIGAADPKSCEASKELPKTYGVWQKVKVIAPGVDASVFHHEMQGGDQEANGFDEEGEELDEERADDVSSDDDSGGLFGDEDDEMLAALAKPASKKRNRAPTATAKNAKQKQSAGAGGDTKPMMAFIEMVYSLPPGKIPEFVRQMAKGFLSN